MNIFRKLAIAAFGTATIVLATAGIAGADHTIPSYGDSYYDTAGQDVYMGAKACTVTAADPVVVTVNGSRRLRSTNTVVCNSTVKVGRFTARFGLQPNTTLQEKTSAAIVTGTQASFVIERTCNGTINNSFSSFSQVLIDFNLDGYGDAWVSDLSRWNLRSCSI